ncbi:hypothetical protein EJC51_34425 [Streptomyces aquilus]|uniref:Uncharacterized protein n=1 Tax=Streptomyces aquilus TaxID=2548456 RepID=A0A3Q9C0E7_9ACTN|nr:hypothetical protein [Streptomyces aquilus]AZP20723.1 hypothetical protein EJC51_34425 [Streptomyces aquilus]
MIDRLRTNTIPGGRSRPSADGHGRRPPTTTSHRQPRAPILEKAGITFPDPADLPSLPTLAKPGEPGEELPSLHRQAETA